jgi:small nuclear ribonucleoprotein (snRNP)-like protein
MAVPIPYSYGATTYDLSPSVLAPTPLTAAPVPSTAPMAPGPFGPTFVLDASTPSFLAPPGSAGITMRVLLYDGQLVLGTFVSFDPAWNPVVQDCVELHPQAGRHMPGPLIFPRVVIASLAIGPPLSPSLPSNHVRAPPLALSAHPAASPLSPSPTDWVVDSGASFHTTPTTSSLFHCHPPHPHILSLSSLLLPV